MLGNDLINGISEQDWDIQLKDNGNCCQYDTEDQQKTVSSDETQYFKKSFAAFAFSRIFYCLSAHTVTSFIILPADTEEYLALSSGN